MGLEDKIRIIPHQMLSASMSLAIDRALLDLMKENIESGKKTDPILRTYQFEKPTIIYGHFQKIEGKYNPKIFENNVEITKRDSGGGHVYYSPKDIHYSFIAPISFHKKNDLTLMYQEINQKIVDALQDCGYDVKLGRTSIRESKDNKIIAGTARRHEQNISLHQGGILFTEYTANILDALMATDAEKERWPKLVSYLKENNYTQNIPTKIAESFSNKNIHYENLTLKELELANTYLKEKYSNTEFIYRGDKEEGICLIALEWTKDNDKYTDKK
jgi:lipoate-protein ligase A